MDSLSAVGAARSGGSRAEISRPWQTSARRTRRIGRGPSREARTATIRRSGQLTRPRRALALQRPQAVTGRLSARYATPRCREDLAPALDWPFSLRSGGGLGLATDGAAGATRTVRELRHGRNAPPQGDPGGTARRLRTGRSGFALAAVSALRIRGTDPGISSPANQQRPVDLRHKGRQRATAM